MGKFVALAPAMAAAMPYVAAGATAISFMGQMKAASGAEKAGRYNREVALRNQKVAENKAKLLKHRAEMDIVDFRADFDRLNKAAAQTYMKNGIVSTSGTALEVQMQNAMEAEMDIQKIRANAAADSADLKEKGINERLRGEIAFQQAKISAQSMRSQAFGSLLSNANTVSQMF